MKLSELIGGEILDEMNGRIKVNVRQPDVVVKVEIRETAAYVHAGQRSAAGGLPVGTSGHGLLLLSGGIDSPVAGYMMAKRGLFIDALHFESFPYTSERAREKVLELAKELVPFASGFIVDAIAAIYAAVLLWVCCFRTGKLNRPAGILMLISYVVYFFIIW